MNDDPALIHIQKHLREISQSFVKVMFQRKFLKQSFELSEESFLKL